MKFKKNKKNVLQFEIKKNIILLNKLNQETIKGDLINEEQIEGKDYYVVRNEKNRVIKLTKEAYVIQKL